MEKTRFWPRKKERKQDPDQEKKKRKQDLSQEKKRKQDLEQEGKTSFKMFLFFLCKFPPRENKPLCNLVHQTPLSLDKWNNYEYIYIK